MSVAPKGPSDGQAGLASLMRRAVSAARTRGFVHVVRSAAEIVSIRLSDSAQLWYHLVLRSRRRYTLAGRPYRYFYHKHNRTWLNERSVEVPIVWDVVRRHPAGSVLEVGNVLSHYFPVSHDIVDKYERAPGVLNIDVVDLSSDKRYRLIVTISTLEHVGWDENPVSKERVDLSDDKIIRAIGNLQRHLTDDGEILITVPLGHNPILDSQIEGGWIPLESQMFMVRVSKDNRWEQADRSRCRGARYGHPFTMANAIAILRVRKDSRAPGKDGPEPPPSLGGGATP